MNAPHPMHKQLALTQMGPIPADNDINLTEYWDIIVDSRWLIAGITALSVVLGATYAFLAKPVYESNLLIQVEDSSTSAKSFLGDSASLFDVKTPAAGEIEIIRSRMVIGQAVEDALLYIDARPTYLPFFGNWLARHSHGLSDPGFMGIGGWVTGRESIKLSAFEVPPGAEGQQFIVTARGQGRYSLSHPDFEKDLEGTIGVPLMQATPVGAIKLIVTALEGKPGAEFTIVRYSKLKTIEGLQEKLQLTEKGRQSGVIDATLQHTDRDTLTTVLNEIGHQYVKQNVERKAAEAQKTLAFLDEQLPQFKKELDKSEDAYNQYRNKKGTVSLDEEAKLILAQSVDLNGKLMEAQQKRRELVARFTADHPLMKTLDEQIAAWKRGIDDLNGKIKALPAVQQDAVRLERDVKVNNDLYQQLRNNALQLQLVREGKIGNVRLIDSAATPETPVKPKKALVLLIAFLAGFSASVLIAIVRSAFFHNIRNAQEIEAQTGLNVYSTIPLSDAESAMKRLIAEKQPGIHLLAQNSPQDMAIESLRSLRTALSFAMLDASNNRILITGATPGVGKSFVSANFAAVMAGGGKRVLLIDADLRKGHLNQYFGVGRGSGLSELILGSVTPAQAIRHGLVQDLDFIPTGTLPPNPAELVMSPAFGKMLDALSTQYDYVIIDTAPILAAADTLSVALHAGTLLLVARDGQTQIGELHESARRLTYAGRTVSGVLFNGVDLTRRHYGNYAYRLGGYKYRHYGYASN